MLDETLKNARILIVDDQESNILVVESMLERQGYSDLKSVTDPRQTLPLLDEFKPDLILLDLHMPHLDGFAVMEQLRGRIPADDYLPILVLTADITSEAKLRALSMGARDFLTKPLDVAEVSLRVRNLLETRYLHLQQKNQNQILEERVRERTADLERQFRRLSALRTIETAISSSTDLRVTLRIIVEQVATQLEADAVSILLYDPHLLTLEYASGSGFRSRTIEGSRVRLGEGIAGRAILDRELIVVHDIREVKDFARANLLAEENFTCYWGAPLVSKGEIKGLLEIFHRHRRAEDSAWLDFLKALAGQSAIAIDNAQLFERLKRSNTELMLAYDSTIEGWSRAMDLRDRETEGHTRRVTEMTLELARLAGMSESELVHVRRGALLHDMGKLGIPDGILLKPGTLTDEEWEIMRRHPKFAFDMLSPIAYLKTALDIPYCHHEKWDGTGYPRGLKGEQIPLAARLFAVADVWDALTSDRPYRPAWTKEQALEYIREQSGRHFDPNAVELFLQATMDAR